MRGSSSPRASHVGLIMQDVFYFIASLVLLECGYFMWLLIEQQRIMRRDDEQDIGLIESVRQEWHDG